MTDGGAWRLPEPWGSLIDRDRSVSFLFDGNGYQGFEGDTVASALAANGRLLLSRSFKYHRPRAALSFAGLDANSYVRVADEPNVLADMLPVAEGLVANSQNRIGSLDRDLAVHAGRFSRFLPVGFYYRAFFRPQGIWAFWERLFRYAAGLGRIDTHSTRGYFDKQYLFADVAVIGAGPAGLSAALAAARGGAGVLLIEEAPLLGGSLNYARFQSDRASIDALRQDLLQQVAQESNIRVLADATCSGWFPDNWLSISQSKRLYKLRATYVIACTGSVEQPMVFRNNDLPGVLPASGVQRLMRLYGVCPGRQAVIVTANAEGYDVALDLLEAGVAVQAIINLGPCANPALLEGLRAKGVSVHDSCAVTEAVPGPGLRSITGVVVTRLMESGEAGRDSWSIDCDLLVTSVGYAPLGQLACHAGGKLVYDDELNSFVVRNRPPNSRASAGHTA